MPIQSKNPATEEVIRTYEEVTDAELEHKLALAEKAFQVWKNTSFTERAKLFQKMSNYLKEHKEALGDLATLEMGKLKLAGQAEVEKCATCCEYYAENAEKILQTENFAGSGSENYIEFEPLGTVLAVMPWNFPYWQVFRAAIPALMAGNVMLLKHASNVPACAEAIEFAFTECGFPEGVFQNLFLSSERIEKVLRDPRVMATTLTGSEKAGASVASIAASEIKKSVLELGGSDAFIVLKDADIDLAATVAAKARMQMNAGQSCISAKRFIVEKEVAEKFITLLVKEFAKFKIGDPAEDGINIGPMATEQGLKDIERQVKESVTQGAKIVYGGKRFGTKGYFYEPTILTDLKKDMPVWNEEVFGPVLPVVIAKDEEQAIRMANDTIYGLGSTIFTQDIEKAKKLARRIEAGAVFINGQVHSDSRAPFGGIKHSGYGRELGTYGIKEFVNVKTIWIK